MRGKPSGNSEINFDATAARLTHLSSVSKDFPNGYPIEQEPFTPDGLIDKDGQVLRVPGKSLQMVSPVIYKRSFPLAHAPRGIKYAVIQIWNGQFRAKLPDADG